MAEITIVFTKADNYRILPVAGVWGGLTPQGDVIAEFFLERRELPDSVTMDVKEEGGKAREVAREGGDKIVRELQVGISLQPDQAYSIGAWLIEKARLAGIDKGPEPTNGG